MIIGGISTTNSKFIEMISLYKSLLFLIYAFILIVSVFSTNSPTGQPSSQPSSLPSSQPSCQPSGLPSSQPSNQPTSSPTQQPSVSTNLEEHKSIITYTIGVLFIFIFIIGVPSILYNNYKKKQQLKNIYGKKY
jgi:cytoskeletal protein RodZ